MASKTQETATAADNLINIYKDPGGEHPFQREAARDLLDKVWPGFNEAMDRLVRARSL